MYDPKRIEHLLLINDVTQRDLARRIGYDEASISRYLNNRQPITRKFAVRVAHEFGVPIEWLETPAATVETAS